MADRKITDLTALAAGSQATGDLLPIVDVSEAAAADKNKKITIESLFKGIPGDVGIGTTSPGNILHVHQTDATANSYVHITQADGGSGATDGLSIGIEDGGVNAAIRNRENGYLRMFTNNTERMRIDSSGNVGINQTPTRELSLHSPNNNNSFIHFTNDDTGETSSDGALVGIDGNEDLNINNQESSKNIIFRNSGSERMRIDSSGRLLIAATSSTGSINADDLQIGSPTDSTQRGITIASSLNGSIRFADDGNDTAGYIFYSHSDNSLRLGANGAERMRIDSSGNVGIGISSIARGPLHINSSTTDTFFHVTNSTTGSSGSDGFTLHQLGNDTVLNNRESANMRFYTADTERMRIDSSGAVCIGRTDSVVGTNKLALNGDGSSTIVGVQTGATSATVNFAQFFDGDGTSCGGIAVNATTNTTSYITTSDYRLKENIVDITGAIARFNNLAPKRFNFIDDETQTTLDGFIAHEVQIVVPEAVVGDHNEVDDDNNPVYQGIDQSKLVPLLTAALQEAIAKIETLETKVAALEAQ